MDLRCYQNRSLRMTRVLMISGGDELRLKKKHTTRYLVHLLPCCGGEVTTFDEDGILFILRRGYLFERLRTVSWAHFGLWSRTGGHDCLSSHVRPKEPKSIAAR